MSERCKARVIPPGQYGAFHANQCQKKAIKDGYCTVHHPDYIAAKHAKWEEKFKEEQEVRRAKWRLEKAAPALLEACKLALPELEGYARRNPNDNSLNMPIRALETAIKLAEEK